MKRIYFLEAAEKVVAIYDDLGDARAAARQLIQQGETEVSVVYVWEHRAALYAKEKNYEW